MSRRSYLVSVVRSSRIPRLRAELGIITMVEHAREFVQESRAWCAQESPGLPYCRGVAP